MNNNDIELIVHKFLTGEISEQEYSVLKAKYNIGESVTEEITLLWKISQDIQLPINNWDANAAYNNLISTIESHEQINVDRSKSIDVNNIRILTVLRSVAAIFVFLICGYVVFEQYQDRTFKSGDNIRFVELKDGSLVWLAPQSKFSIKRNFIDSREVTLDGKAYFDIHNMENASFTILTENFEVDVIGTSFTVDQSTNSVEVRSGKVDVRNEITNVSLVKGEKIEYFDNANFEKGRTNQSDFYWINSKLSFDNTPLDRVLEEIGLYFDVEFSSANQEKIAKCLFTASDLSKLSIQEVISVLKTSFELQIDYDNNTNTAYVSNIHCQ